MVPFEQILYEQADGVGTITLNRPETLNALSWKMLTELSDALSEAELDDEVRVVVIKGAGRCFSSGYDISAQEGLTGPRAKRKPRGKTVWNSRAHVQGHVELLLKIWDLWKPVVAQVHSYCLAGASELAMICDLTVVSDDARIGYPPVRFMATGDAIALYSWLLGMKKAKELSFGLVIKGEEAVRYGLANHCFPLDQLEAETRQIAQRIAQIDPELLSLSKTAVNRTFDQMGFRTSLLSGGEFDSLSHFSQAATRYRELVRELGLPEALKKLNEPWKGV